jgi:hypothetical protein
MTSQQCVSALIERVQHLGCSCCGDLPNTVFLEAANKILTTGLPETVIYLAEELAKKNVEALHVQNREQEYEDRIQRQKATIEACDAQHTADKARIADLEAALAGSRDGRENERTAHKARIAELEAALAESKKGRDSDRATWTEWHKQYEERFNALLADYNRVTGKT